MIIIGGILLLIMGLVMLVSPATFYEITESWKSNSVGEPSDLFIISTRVGGVACTLAGIGAIVVFLMK